VQRKKRVCSGEIKDSPVGRFEAPCLEQASAEWRGGSPRVGRGIWQRNGGEAAGYREPGRVSLEQWSMQENKKEMQV